MGAFQTVFDNAQTISINKKKKVGQSVARDGTIKTTSFGGQVWTFEVKLPDGMPWTSMRPLIEQMEALDRVTTSTVQISNPNLSYISGYQGNLNTTTTITASFSTGNTLTVVSAPAIGAGYRFKSGDVIQLGTSGGVYSIVNDVAYNGGIITLNRPVREAAGTYTLIVGQSVTWNVICTTFPQWTLFDHNQVSWSGPFIFSEAL